MTITLDGLVAGIEREKRDAQRRFDAAYAACAALLEGVAAAGRENLTREEDKRLAELTKERRTARDRLDEINDKLEEARKVALEQSQHEAAARDVRPTGAVRRTYEQVHRVGMEERTYRPDDSRTGRPSFFRDLALGQCFNDPAASQRLARHARETEIDGLAGPQQRLSGLARLVVSCLPRI
jgi:hypothetical protein